MSKPFETYRDRDENLRYLGFSSYSDYLASPLWAVIRDRIYARDNYRCTALYCSLRRVRLEAHHVSYALPVLLGIDPGAIVTLCANCHDKVEYTRKKKLNLDQVQKKSILRFRKNNGMKFKSVLDFLRYRHKTEQDHVARYILAILAARETVWYDRILRELSIGKLPKSYLTYLRLNK